MNIKKIKKVVFKKQPILRKYLESYEMADLDEFISLVACAKVKLTMNEIKLLAIIKSQMPNYFSLQPLPLSKNSTGVIYYIDKEIINNTNHTPEMKITLNHSKISNNWSGVWKNIWFLISQILFSKVKVEATLMNEASDQMIISECHMGASKIVNNKTYLSGKMTTIQQETTNGANYIVTFSNEKNFSALLIAAPMEIWRDKNNLLVFSGGLFVHPNLQKNTYKIHVPSNIKNKNKVSYKIWRDND